MSSEQDQFQQLIIRQSVAAPGQKSLAQALSVTGIGRGGFFQGRGIAKW